MSKQLRARKQLRHFLEWPEFLWCVTFNISECKLSADILSQLFQVNSISGAWGFVRLGQEIRILFVFRGRRGWGGLDLN
jgi:hypothetical protein